MNSQKKSFAFGGAMYAAGGSFNNPGFAKLPKDVQAKIKARTFADGGPMAQLTEFNEGGRHEENPIGGIPQGFAPDGRPNLVEQGETKLNSEDYIYSDTLKVTKDIALDFSLPKNSVGKTFAQVSKEANRPKSRRENDTIEEVAIKRDLDNLMQAQEEFKKRDLEKDMQMMMEKHPEQMQQLMAGAEMAQQGMPQEGMMPPQEMAPEEQIPQSAQMGMPQGQPMDPNQIPPEMLAQMPEAQQGMPVMRMGGGIYKCGGKMYNFGGTMYANGGHMYNPGGPLLGGATTGSGYMSGYAAGSNPSLVNPGVVNPWATNNTTPIYDMMHQYDAQPASNPMFDLNANLDVTPDIATTGDAAGGASQLMGKVGTGVGIASSVAQGALGAANVAQQEGLTNKQKAEQYSQLGVDAGMGVVGSIFPIVGAAYGVGKGIGNLADKMGEGSDEIVMSPDGTEQVVRHNKEGLQVTGDVLSNMFNPAQNVSQGMGYLADKDYKKAALTFLAPLGGAQIARAMDRKEDNKKADAWDRMRKGPQFSTLGMPIDDRVDTDPTTNPYSLYSKKYGGRQYALGGAPQFGTPNTAAMLNNKPGRSTFGADYNIGAKPTGGPGGGAFANRSDSLAVSNNARAVHDFYRSNSYERNKVGIGKPGTMYELQNLGSTPWKTLDQAKKNMQDRTAGSKTITPSPIGITSKTKPLVTGYGNKNYTNINQYYKANPNNSNQFWQREINSGVLNLDAPMGFYDKRIEPQTWSVYSHPSSGDSVTMPQYDPIAVAPIDTLKDKDLLYRLENYGTSGFNESTLRRLGYPTNSGTKTKVSNPQQPKQPAVEPVQYDKDGVPIVTPPRDPFAIPDVVEKPIPTMDEMMAGTLKEPMIDIKPEEFYFRPAHEQMYNEYGEKIGNRTVSVDEVKRRFATGEDISAFSPYASSDKAASEQMKAQNLSNHFNTQLDYLGNKFYLPKSTNPTELEVAGAATARLSNPTAPVNPQYIDRRFEGDPYVTAMPESQKYFGAGTMARNTGEGMQPYYSDFNEGWRKPNEGESMHDFRIRQRLDNNDIFNWEMNRINSAPNSFPYLQAKQNKMGGFLDSDFSMYGNSEAHSYATGGKFEGDPMKGDTRVNEEGIVEIYNGTDWETTLAEVDPDSLITPELLTKEEENNQAFIDDEAARLKNAGLLESDLTKADETLKDKNLDLEMNQSLPEFLSAAAPAAYNLGQGIFGKVQKLNPDDYRVREDMEPYRYNIEPQLRSADRSFAQGQNAIRNAGLSGGNYASNMQQLANARNQEISDLYAQKQNMDAASYNQAMAQNKAIEAENLQRRLGIEDFNRQSEAAKTAMLQAGMQQLAQISEGSQGKKMQLALMKAIAPDFAGTLSYNNIMDQYLNKVKKKKESKKTK